MSFTLQNKFYNKECISKPKAKIRFYVKETSTANRQSFSFILNNQFLPLRYTSSM